jgi:sugar phosphate isomerase/epimerase
MFKLAVFSDEVSQDLAEAIQFAKEFKLSGLSIRSVWNKKGPQVITIDEAKKIKSMCGDAGLNICEVASPFYKCDIDRPEEIAKHHDWLKHFIDLAGVWDTRLIRVFAFWRKGKYDDYAKRIADLYARPLEIVKGTNVILCIENEGATFVGTGRQTRDFLDRLNHPQVRVAWDPCNVVGNDEGEKPFPDGYRLIKDKMAHFHLKDGVRGEKPYECKCVEVGKGEVDYPGQLKALIADKYDGFLSLETHWRVTELSEDLLNRPGGAEFTKDAKTASRICMQNVQRMLKEIGA